MKGAWLAVAILPLLGGCGLPRDFPPATHPASAQAEPAPAMTRMHPPGLAPSSPSVPPAPPPAAADPHAGHRH